MKHFRQGDVLFVKVNKIPEGKVRLNGHILEGEATGHVHRVETLTEAEVYEVGEEIFLRVGDNGVSIVHPDHGTLQLPSGNFRVQRQREYSPEEIHNVQD